jgi:hypothetical protein
MGDISKQVEALIAGAPKKDSAAETEIYITRSYVVIDLRSGSSAGLPIIANNTSTAPPLRLVRSRTRRLESKARKQ